ncbi:Signal transduction histidine kinase [Paenibacillus sp. UNCCL117]|uniref:HAMP domain-containing sensor histidine kinase n=1 Tax=unclassified Paenibacillus TaxID=185978 RepID=UPI00088A1A78|nr:MULTISPECIES: HAMP domain-containing sensor histidine kinase [unclassified Paenibacillus]SDE14683.1 Signal transduction histidine kinase [Paenibacillus sp. cl123]SFW60669.1 Signal transduction histidine kinase [Paenibacillus sp. UNCCL117]
MIRTIRTKFMIGFFIIFGVFFLILQQWVSINIESGNRNTVNNQLQDLKNNSNSFIQQSFLTHHFTSDEIYFEQIAEETATVLQYAASSGVAMYSIAGELLYASDQAAFTTSGEDLQLARQGKTAYTLTRAKRGASVLFAYPVVVHGTKVGIVRFAKDFTPLYEQSGYIQRTIFSIALAVFAAAFLFSYLLCRHITVPLSKLTKATTEVMNGNFNIRIEVKQKDEVGQLAVNFSSMVEKLREQFAIIEKDRDRLEELNHHRKRFFDQVTHELKTPLTTIMGYAEIIRKNGINDPALFQKGVNHIVDESKRLHAMVLELLERSKATGAHHTDITVDAAQILLDVCDTMAIKAQRYKKTIRCEADKGLFIRGKSDRLRQLFINLLDNAIKYSYAHTEIIVIASLEDDRIRMIVSNQGKTISADNLAKIFEPYYRAGHPYTESASIGLGLSICKGIVDEHRGRIQISSDNGYTNVDMDFPLAKA